MSRWNHFGFLVFGSLVSLLYPSTLAWGQLGATQPDAFRVPAGFQVELLYEVPLESQGSWVCMCVALDGRLIVSDQYGKLYWVKLGQTGAKPEVSELKVPAKIGAAQGLLHTKDGLYVDINGDGPSGGGLYRLQDKNNDGEFESMEHLIPMNAGGEHGPHAIIPGPDGRLYICAGNATDLPATAKSSRVPRHWSEDHLLGRMPDGRGFMKDRLAPGGFVLSMKPDGSDQEVVATGFRNEYDIAFNELGDLFSYDADMEWDIGTPWYRPTRVNHVQSGAEFGWRNGTGKWPEYYADSMGAVANVGPGSPTGIVFGYGAKFPAKYQQALYIGDWSYGVIYAVHLTPEGASYASTIEPFMSAAPLPITDMVIHKDGCMYLTVGGRKVQSALYRLRYTGAESTAKSSTVDSSQAKQSRDLRRRLENFHRSSPSQEAVALALKEIGNPDRSIRFAARIALEHQPVDQWRSSLAKAATSQAKITLAVALARCGKPTDQASIHAMLTAIDWNSLNRVERLELLRAYQLSFTRLGTETPSEARQKIVQQLDGQFPTKDEDTHLNRELASLLIYLNAPGIVKRCVDRMSKAQSVDEQIQYAMNLRATKNWEPALRTPYFQWFFEIASARGGASFGGFIENIRQAALANLNDQEREALGELAGNMPPAKDPLADLAPRALVKNWQMTDLVGELESTSHKLDFEKGKQMFAVAQCYKCHRFAGQGGIQGPDITGAGGRFSPKDLLASIIEPNKEISDQYQATQFITEEGTVVTGRVANLNGDTLMILTNMLDPGNFTNLKRSEIDSSKPSPNSMMPSGLLDTLSQAEILDLLAYLRSGGNPTHAIYSKPSGSR